MDCRTGRKWITDYLDDELGLSSRFLARWHLISCDRCFAEYERLEGTGALISSLPAPQIPRFLRMRILLKTSRVESSGFWASWQVHLKNLLRPLAVPAAGGVVTAILLFGALMPSLWVSPQDWSEDVPLTYFANAWISNPVLRAPSPLAVSKEITVQAFIDHQGRMYDFQIIPVNQPPVVRDELRMQMASTLLTTQFRPAMNFGRPVRGQIVLSFVQVDVQG